MAGIDLVKFQKVQAQVKSGASKKAVLARHKISEQTLKRIMAVRSFAAYQRATAERAATEKSQRDARRKAAAKEFNKPMQGVSVDTMQGTYKPRDPAKQALVKAELDDELPEPKKPSLFDRIFRRG